MIGWAHPGTFPKSPEVEVCAFCATAVNGRSSHAEEESCGSHEPEPCTRRTVQVERCSDRPSCPVVRPLPLKFGSCSLIKGENREIHQEEQEQEGAARRCARCEQSRWAEAAASAIRRQHAARHRSARRADASLGHRGYSAERRRDRHRHGRRRRRHAGERPSSRVRRSKTKARPLHRGAREILRARDCLAQGEPPPCRRGRRGGGSVCRRRCRTRA